MPLRRFSSTLSILLAAGLLLGAGRPIPSASPPAHPYVPRSKMQTSIQPVPPTYLRLAPPGPGAQVYARVELSIDSDAVFANPFDPAQADLSVRFTAPSGKSAAVPAFWYQEFDLQTLAPLGQPGWRARFTPEEPGRWTAQAELSAPTLASPPLTFLVAPGTDHGFIGIDPRNPRQFAARDGAFFLPIGTNIAWATSIKATLADYTRWFDALSQNGGNFARLWMPSWGLGIEWQDTGLGDYTNRLLQAWLLDQVFRLAEARGIQILLCLQNHGAFSETVNPEWAGNPYNAAVGGMLEGPGDFVTDPAARAYFQRRLRYIAARYAYSTHLFAWEWWNEVDWTPINDRQLKPWLEEMSAYLHGLDPYRHLQTISYARGEASGLWDLPEIDFVQRHDYTGRDPLVSFKLSYDALARLAPAKPAILAECAASPDGPGRPGQEAIFLHNAIWAAPFLGYASTGMYWWWDSFIDPQRLWTQFQGISEFLQGEDLAEMKPAIMTASPGVNALALQSPGRALVWLRSREYDGSGYQVAYNQARLRGLVLADLPVLAGGPGGQDADAPGWQFQPHAVHSAILILDGLPDGAYSAAWFDPQQSRWLAPVAVTVQSGRAILTAPDFRKDLAVKVVPFGKAIHE